MQLVEVEKANFLLDNIDLPKTSCDQASTSVRWIVSINFETGYVLGFIYILA